MTDERKYGDDEVRAIFELAAGTQESSPVAAGSGTGLTLGDLQEIGREVGLDPNRVAEAASQLEVRRSAPMRRSALGLPISVGRTVELPRPLSDTEWEVLVGEIRETFAARGKVSTHGSLREWTNGNLHVFLETTENGSRLRMRTTKGTAVFSTRMGAGIIAVAAVLFVVGMVTGQGVDVMGLTLLAALGLGAIGTNVLTLPPWARERDEQMEYLAARALSLTERGGE